MHPVGWPSMPGAEIRWSAPRWPCRSPSTSWPEATRARFASMPRGVSSADLAPSATASSSGRPRRPRTSSESASSGPCMARPSEMLRPFALHRPSTLHEVGHLLGEYRGESALYAGGTELLLLLKEGFLRPAHLIDVKRVPRLGDITIEDRSVLVGATATHRTIERSPVLRASYPIVPAVAQHVANVRVRNVGTVGGNIAFADPHSDLASLLLALDGRVRLWRRGLEREVLLAEFVRGPYETAREEDEIVTAVRLFPWPVRTVATYVKHGLHERPTLGIALALTLDADARTVLEARLAVGCVGPRPERLAIGAEVRGRALADVLADGERRATAAAESVEPVDDLHGSADYKRDMTRVFVRRALAIAGARAAGRDAVVRYPHTVVV